MGIYLAGSITDDPDHREKFARVATELRRRGFVVVNPVEFGELEDASYENYLHRDITEGLVRCDAIVLLPGWPRSRGACAEFNAATAMGYSVGIWDNAFNQIVWVHDKRGVSYG